MSETVKTRWNVDTKHSEISFRLKQMMTSTEGGHFKEFSAKIETDNDDFIGADFDFKVKRDSIVSKNNDRDTHLKSDDLFNAVANPEIVFKSTNFDGNNLKGDLTLRGIAKEIKLDVEFNGVAEDPYGKTKAGFEMIEEVNRKDFDLNWSDRDRSW